MSAESGVVLSIAHAARRYGTRIGLDDVSLHLREGEVYALIGRNGAGKSTLVKAIVGALSLDAGSVRVLDADPARDPAARRAIGVAPQDIALYGHMTVAENLDAFAALGGVREGRAAAVRTAMADAVCEACAHQRVDQLSGGWRRRVNLAAAIVHEPKLLLLDEPTEGLDIETRAVMRRLVMTLRARGTAILLISHDAEDVTRLADRVGILHAGRLVMEGEPAGLLGQAFGGRQDLIIRLAAGADGGAVLQGRGLAPSDDGQIWTGRVDNAPGLALEIDQALRTAGVAIEEMTIRPPGLITLIDWAADAAGVAGASPS